MFSQNPTEVLIVLDYDDTMLPSTQLTRLMKQHRDSLHIKSAFDLPRSVWYDQAWKKYEDYILEALKQLNIFGRVCIVTNAQENWVQWSCQMFFPKVWQEIKKLEIISARSSFESVSTSCSQWKIKAFEKLYRQYQPSQVLSLGDSYLERLAAKTVFPNKCKTVKFSETPSISMLHCQWKLLMQNYTSVVNHSGVLDLKLTIHEILKPDLCPLSKLVR